MKKEVCDCNGGDCHSMPKILAVLAIILLAGILVAVSFNAGINSSPSNVILNSDGKLDVKTLSVSGNVTKMVSPNKVDIVLSVETLDLLAQKSQSDNAVIADKVKGSLEALSSVKAEVKTVSYSVNEEFEWNDITKKSESIGYRTVNQIQVTLNEADISSAGKIIDIAVENGANRVSSIAFGLTKSRELAVRKTALNEASSTAKIKAESIAQGLGITIGEVRTVSENSFYYTPNYANYDLAKVAGSAEAVSTPIVAGDVEVSASVAVEFELK
ncbi:MAG: SIMPL domain-containing protein [archaeon]|jgi:hypothetical protein